MTATTADFANDASVELDYLKGRAEVDARKMGLLGHSEGGMIATMLAAQRKDVAFIISFAGPGISNLELMVAQNDAILKQKGLREDARKAYLQLYRQMMKAAVDTKDEGALKTALNNVVLQWRQATPQNLVQETTGISDDASQAQFVSAFAAQLGLPWFRYFIAYDPATLAGKISCKVLVLNGAKDVQVVSAPNMAGWQALLKKSNAKSYTVTELPGLNHLFQECVSCDVDEYGALEQTISPKALSTIGDWLDKEVK
jgi:pimeloyl-ACP methyl ester carboxylesterase